MSKFGNGFYYFTLNWWIAKTTNNPKLLGYIGVASTLPLFSGVGCIIYGLLINLDTINVPLTIGINVLLGSSMATFSPALRSIIPDIIEEKSIKKVNSLVSTFSSIIKVSLPSIVILLLVGDYLNVKEVFL